MLFRSLMTLHTGFKFFARNIIISRQNFTPFEETINSGRMKAIGRAGNRNEIKFDGMDCDNLNCCIILFVINYVRMKSFDQLISSLTSVFLPDQIKLSLLCLYKRFLIWQINGWLLLISVNIEVPIIFLGIMFFATANFNFF